MPGDVNRSGDGRCRAGDTKAVPRNVEGVALPPLRSRTVVRTAGEGRLEVLK